MTDSNNTWFDDATRTGAPSAKLKEIGDVVVGTIADQFQIDYVPFGKKEPQKDERTGEVIKQLVVVLQTDKRNWEGVAKVPSTEAGVPKAASEDTGLRAIYIRKYTNIHAAFGAALAEAQVAKGTGVATGGQLWVQLYDQEDVQKGNPLNKFRAKYKAPEASAGFNGGEDSANAVPEPADPFASAPAPAATPAPEPAPTSAAEPAPQTQAAPATVASTDEPPF